MSPLYLVIISDSKVVGSALFLMFLDSCAHQDTHKNCFCIVAASGTGCTTISAGVIHIGDLSECLSSVHGRADFSSPTFS